MISNAVTEKKEELATETPAAQQACVPEALLLQLAEDNSRQTAAIEKQLFWTKVQTWAVCGALVLMLVVVFSFAGRVSSALDQLNVVLTDVQSVTSSLKATVDEADIAGLLSNANGLILESRSSLTEALAQVGEAVGEFRKIDFEGLNSAIKDLQAVVEPLARLFGK